MSPKTPLGVYRWRMTAAVDLIWLGGDSEPPIWTLGAVVRAERTPDSLHCEIRLRIDRSTADAWLFWDSALERPVVSSVIAALSSPGDLWHAGLPLGLGTHPGVIDFISPAWPLNRDPDANLECTSWRVSLRACLVRTSVLRWGAPRADFETLDGAALEWGHRAITFGVLPRNYPRLLERTPNAPSAEITLTDEFRFARARFGASWSRWAAARSLLTGYAPFGRLANAWIASRSMRDGTGVGGFAPNRSTSHAAGVPPSVSVLIPTLDRYPYLRTVLTQLGEQTSPPLEIIVIDQTPLERRESSLASEFSHLPMVVISLNEAGQCTSRNAGLLRARGDHILFLDDDVEIASDLIERHIRHLATTNADVSSGVAFEPTTGSLPEAFRRARASDVFPTHNTLARRSALERSGLFDLAYDHGSRANGDLGMRIYLTGAVMLLDPSISVLHHHAPRGGLRTHGARVITYGSSRRRIRDRSIPEVTELYRAFRYSSARQVHEVIVQAAVGTLSIHGSAARRLLKLVYGLALMPSTFLRLKNRLALARKMLGSYPQIPMLPLRPR